MITLDHESRRPASGAGFADAITYSFADPDAGWYGLARLGLTDEGASALAVLFRDREPIAAEARGSLEVAGDADWEDLQAGPLHTHTLQPLERWRVVFEDGEHAFELTFAATSAPAAIDLAAAGGMTGYEQLCAVEGTIRSGGDSAAISGLGQRGHSWGAPDWSRVELARNVAAWLGEDAGGLTLTSLRESNVASHADERIAAVLVREGDPVEVDEPRLSTTYDADGRQRRAGIELWVRPEDDYAFRAAGEVVCGSTLDLGQLRMDLAFLRWHAEGHDGIGRYDIVRRA